jgi:WD40 repeat protein
MEKLKEMIKTNATSIKPSPGLTFGGFGNSTSSNVTVKSIRNRTTRIVYTDPSMLFANAVLRNGEILVGGQNNSILVLDPANFTLRTTIKGHTNFVYDILELPDGSVATCSYDQNLLIFDPLNGSIKHTLRGHTGYVYSIILLPDGRIASGSSDKNIRIWNTSTGKCEQVYGAGHNGHVYILAVVDEGNGTKRLVSGNGGEKSDTGITFWNITSGATERKLLGHDGGVCSLHALPNNRLVSGCLTDNVIRVWDLTTYKCIASLPGHSSGVACMVVTPDGKRLVTGGYDFAVRVWNLTKFSLEKEFIGHTAIVRSVCLTHDGDILSCGDDKTLRLWNME